MFSFYLLIYFPFFYMNMVVFIQAYKNSPFILCCDQELIVFGFPSLMDNQTTLNAFLVIIKYIYIVIVITLRAMTLYLTKQIPLNMLYFLANLFNLINTTLAYVPQQFMLNTHACLLVLLVLHFLYFLYFYNIFYLCFWSKVESFGHPQKQEIFRCLLKQLLMGSITSFNTYEPTFMNVVIVVVVHEAVIDLKSNT